MINEAKKVMVRYFGETDFDKIGRLTFADYDLIIDALRDRLEDEDRNRHYAAYLSVIAGQHDAKGKPLYPTFDSFYKHKSTKQDRFEKLKEHLRNKQK